MGIFTIKQVLQTAEKKVVLDGMDYMARTNSVMLQTKDMVTAISSFLEKKKPVFPKL